MTLHGEFARNPDLIRVLGGADDLHVLRFEGRLSMRECLAAMLSYMPGWMRGLYRVRKYFVMLLGTRQDGVPEKQDLKPADISFIPGEKGSFFTIRAAEEDHYWLADARDRMIVGYLGLLLEGSEGGVNRFALVSGAKYRRWTGRVYYNVILPFHHLVIRRMVREALRRQGDLQSEQRRAAGPARSGIS